MKLWGKNNGNGNAIMVPIHNRIQSVTWDNASHTPCASTCWKCSN